MELRKLKSNISEFLDKEIILEGWVKKNRAQKNFGFIELNDGTVFKGIQIVYDEKLENFEDISKLSIYSSIIVKGKLVKSLGKGQDYEIIANDIQCFQKSDLDNPIQNKRHGMDFLRTIPHLRTRTNTFNAVFRVKSLLAQALHKFFMEKDFLYVQTPLFTSIDAEGAGEMFQVTTLDMENVKRPIDYKEDFFEKRAYLTVTGQLHAETFASSFRNVYTFGPTFRAERSFTPRHAAEFWMLEPEMAFVDLEGNMDLAEEMIKYIIRYILENAKEEMEFFNEFIEKGLLDKLDNIVNNKFERITYTKAVDILLSSNKQFEEKVIWGMDLKSEHERYLAEEVFKKPVFVTDYPKDIKAFYMKLNDDNKTVRAMDLLAPGIGEIVGGSQREDDYEKLEKVMREKGLNVTDYQWYLDLRRFGSFVHSGYGLGFDRLIMYVTGMSNIRDVLAFPRTTAKLDF